MYDNQQDLLSALRAGPAILAALLQGISAEMAPARDPAEWAPVEIVCHLRDAEERALERMRAMRDQENPFLPAYDQEAWATERNYRAADLATALAAFTRFRRQHADELAALAPQDWGRTGRHAEIGQITILNHTIHMAAHDYVHAAQLARARE